MREAAASEDSVARIETVYHILSLFLYSSSCCAFTVPVTDHSWCADGIWIEVGLSSDVKSGREVVLKHDGKVLCYISMVKVYVEDVFKVG